MVRRNKVIEGIVLLVILLSAFIVRVHSLSAKEYSNAELTDLIVSRNPHFLETLFSPFNVPNTPFSYLVTHYSIRLLPFELLRLQSVIFSMLGLLFFYLLARMWLGVKYGLWAVLLFSVNLQAIQYSRLLRAYPIFISLAIISQYFFLKWNSGDRRFRTWYFFLAVLLIYTHFFGVVLVAANLLYLLLAKQRISQYFKGYFLSSLALLPWIVVVFLPTFIFTKSAQNALNWISPPTVLGFVSLFSNMVLGHGWWPGFALLLVSVAAFWPSRTKFVYALAQLLSPIAFIWCIWILGGFSLFNLDYFSYLIPFFILFVVNLSFKFNLVLRGSGYVLLILIIGANISSLSNAYSPDSTFSDLAAEVDSRFGGVDVVIYPGYYQAQYELYFFQKVLIGRVPEPIEAMLRNELSNDSLALVLRRFKGQIKGLLEKPSSNFSINGPTLFIFSPSPKSTSLQEWQELLPQRIVGNSTLNTSKFGQFDLILATPIAKFNTPLKSLK